MKKSLLAVILCISTTTIALGNSESSEKRIELDTIVAVVNDKPILKSTLNQRIMIIKRQLEARHVIPPAENILRDQVLNQLIQENVQLQLAESRHIEISTTQVNREIQKIADEQHITLPELFKQAENDGLTRENYEHQLKNQLLIHELIQNMLASKVTISQKDIDLYRHSQLAHATVGKEYQVAHILIALDTSPTVAQVHEAEIKTSALLEKIKRGDLSFEQAAISESLGQFNLQGGDLGFRPIAELPEIFANEIINMQVGDVAGPIRTSNGFQLIKLVAIKNTEQPLSDEQIRQALFKRKLEETYAVWLSSLESQAYIRREPV